MDSSIAPSETLADVLGARARRTPEDRLLLDVIGGILIGAAAIWARPLGWFPLLAAAACFAFYGCWAFAERRLSAALGANSDGSPGAGPVSAYGATLGTEPGASASSTDHTWRIVRQVSAMLGLFSFVTLLFAVLGVALGRQIS